MSKADEFRQKFLQLCREYNLTIVPVYEGTPSAHDPMYIVPFDDWSNYVESDIYTPEEYE